MARNKIKHALNSAAWRERNPEESRLRCRSYYEKNRGTILQRKKNSHSNLNVWKNMIQRCTNAKRPDYKYYGGVGITVCERWLNSFDAFIEDMGVRPSPDHTLDRIEGDKGYYKENCRWATRQEQADNLKSNRKLTALGKTLNLSAWARELNISPSSLHHKLKKRSLEQLINK